MKRSLPLVLAALLLTISGVPVRAQNAAPSPSPGSSDEVRPNFPAWNADLPGGKYMVALRAILAISSHEYIVDGSARVTEVNIATSGDLVARFYYLEPITPQTPTGLGQSAVNTVMEKLEGVAERAGADAVWKRVTKNYPATTHAHTVEFRLETKDQVEKLYKSVETAWKRGKSETYKAKGEAQ